MSATTSAPARAATKATPAFPALADPANELIVFLKWDNQAEYHGTRAAIEAEGILPAGFEFPEGFAAVWAETETNAFWLRRVRPEGLRGPRRQYLTVDFWHLRISPLQVQGPHEQHVANLRKRLAVAEWLASPAGRAQQSELFKRRHIAGQDARFQAFLAAATQGAQA